MNRSQENLLCGRPNITHRGSEILRVKGVGKEKSTWLEKKKKKKKKKEKKKKEKKKKKKQKGGQRPYL